MQHQAFFDTWACKEAVVKAHGGGIMSGLDQFRIQGVQPNPGPRQVVATSGQQTPWQLSTLAMHDQSGQSFVAALAIAAPPACELALSMHDVQTLF